MKNIFTILILGSSLFATAQKSQKEKIDSVKTIFTEYFNEKNADKIYSLAGETFKNQLSAEAFTSICEMQLFPLGTLSEVIFENYKNGMNTYKAVFENATLNLLLSLDDHDKLYTFLFRPYKSPATLKKDSVISSNHLLTEMDKKIDQFIRPYIYDINTASVSIGIIKNGKTSSWFYGETEKGKKQLPDENSIYEIGSLTKTFTAILLADAVKKGMIEIDAPVNRYLPDSIPPLQFNNKAVTVKMLINHSSAIPRMPDNFGAENMDPNNPYQHYSTANLLSYLKHIELKSEPGSVYEYSNTAVGLLGVILENVSKKTYNDLLQETICKPLGMKDTKQTLATSDLPRFCKGYDESGEPVGAWDFQSMAAAGCIRSTLKDQLIYMSANLSASNKQLNNAMQFTHDSTFENKGTKVALGWHILQPAKDQIIFHNGETGGFHSYMAFNKIKNFGVVILSNCAAGTEKNGTDMMKWLEENQ